MGPFLAAYLAGAGWARDRVGFALTMGAKEHGRKPLLLVGFGILPVRALLYTLTHVAGALNAVQVLDGLANAIFGVVAVLVVADRTRGSGRFDLMQGGLATAVGAGAALSASFGGLLIRLHGYSGSFLALGGISAMAFGLLLFAVPETLAKAANDATAVKET